MKLACTALLGVGGFALTSRHGFSGLFCAVDCSVLTRLLGFGLSVESTSGSSFRWHIPKGRVPWFPGASFAVLYIHIYIYIYIYVYIYIYRP